MQPGRGCPLHYRYAPSVFARAADLSAETHDHAGFERDFLANWPVGSPAHVSYYQRISSGPSYQPDAAVRLKPLAAA